MIQEVTSTILLHGALEKQNRERGLRRRDRVIIMRNKSWPGRRFHFLMALLPHPMFVYNLYFIPIMIFPLDEFMV